MKQKIVIIIAGIFAAICLAIGAIVIVNSQPEPVPAEVAFYSIDDIKALAERIDVSDYDIYSVIPVDAYTGPLEEHIKGDPDTASVVIYEFFDYACSHCAETNTELNRIYNDYKGKVAIVYRTYMLGFANSVTAASAAGAAALQGYGEPYKNILFTEQATWSRLQGSKLEQYFTRAFEDASNGAGDVKKFIRDMGSAEVAQRIAFDHALGKSIGVSGTPYLVVDGEHVTASELRERIDDLLNK